MNELLRLRLPANAAFIAVAREAVVALARGLGFAEMERDALRLSVGEACNNAVEHGGPKSALTLCCFADSARLVIEISNPGEPFLPETAAVMPEPDAEGGRGRPIMEALMDEVEYVLTSGETVVRLTKRLP